MAQIRFTWQNSELLEFALLRTEIDHTITQKGEE